MKNNRLTIGLILGIFLILTTASQAQDKKFKVGTIAFYNLENLFDTLDTPDVNDVDFTPAGSSMWNAARYEKKLANMSEAITQIGSEVFPGGPAIIGVSEVENRQVVMDLANTPKMKAAGYQFVHFDGPDRRGIDVALLYRPAVFRVTSTRSARLIVADKPDFRTRDQLVVSGLFYGEPIDVIVNHWPSRSGGEKSSIPLRRAAAELCRSLVDSIYKSNSTAKIIIMGDLNDDPTDPSLTEGLKTISDIDNVKTGDLFNPAAQMLKDGIGSLAYRDSWNLFDQIIVSEPLLNAKAGKLKFLKYKVFNANFLTQKDGQFAGYPFRTYSGGAYTGGYSDHFPTYIIVVKEIIK
ncbi:endonuclease/exonuclease/phosphatase family protein [Williamwhitmania taraxaci]|uniref:Endonuclease/Exonuclease/phosphatase family protein n=1 Tax=Williamwhitmania taraxaci TaxID=1640674 RepID=A0A1G6RVW2_9BACT|nr:endonuclease/exonuclease/phosphatase family protein [Williamwhitmania taraxaci]SDD08708.1 Endonuclease/Exonuclease/phosphatase family protein [Williamwhitmania taraxaci]